MSRCNDTAERAGLAHLVRVRVGVGVHGRAESAALLTVGAYVEADAALWAILALWGGGRR